MTKLERFQKVSFWTAITCAGLGFLTSAGAQILPNLPADSLWLLHPLLFLVGGATGYLSSLRGDEIDRERWRIAEDPALTSGERDYAHRSAERQRRWASVSFLAAPLMTGYWMAYQVEGEGRLLAAQLLPVTACLGSVIGLLAARYSARSTPS